MQIGEVVEMKSATLQFGNEKMRGSFSVKPPTGRRMVFLYLGNLDPKAPDSFSAQAVLRKMGWMPNPEFQAQLDAEAAQNQQPEERA